MANPENRSMEETDDFASFRRFFESSLIGAAVVGLDKTFRCCNPAFCRFLGYSADQVRSMTISDVTMPEDAHLGMAEMKSLLQGSQEQPQVTKRYRRSDGAIVWGQTSISLLHKEDGSPLHFLAIIQDLTRQTLTEGQLREKDLIFQSLLDHSPVYVFFKDHEIRPIHLSRNYEKMLGMPLERILGKTMDELFPSDLAKSMIEADKKILNEGKLIQVDEELHGRHYTTIKFPITRDTQ